MNPQKSDEYAAGYEAGLQVAISTLREARIFNAISAVVWISAAVMVSMWIAGGSQ